MNTQTDGNIDFNDTSAYPVHIINSPGGEIENFQSKTTEMGYKLFKLNGRLIDSKKALFDHIAKEMMFPDYFGKNWDALEECIRDLMEWMPANGYVVLFEDAHLFCQSAPNDFLTFIDIVAGIANEWIDEKVPLFLVLAGDVSLQTFNYGHLKERICIHSSNDAEQVETPVNIDGIEPFADFNDWFALVIEEVKPALVVGIARGAVRLLQLQKAHRILGDIPVVSDHALPFIPDSQIRSKRILLFDDSVIFGSTMSTIRDYLSERGAIVFCASYVVDRTSFYGETERGSNALAKPSKYHNIPLRKKHLLWPNQIRKHHDILIRSILQTPSHYNLDFPTFCFEIPEYTAADIPYLTRLLHRTDVFRGIFDVSTAASSQHGVYRYTALFEKPPGHLFPKNGLFYRFYSKARIICIPRQGEIRLTPIPQLAVKDGMLYEDIKFADETLQLLWDKLHPPYHRDDPFYPQALFRLLTLFVAITIGETITRQIISAMRWEFPVKRMRLLDDDIKFVTGRDNSQTLRRIWSALRDSDVIPSGLPIKSDAIAAVHEPVDSNLLRKTVDVWQEFPWLKPHPSELAYEVFGKVFLTLREVTYSEERRRENPSVRRSVAGFSYGAIRHLLHEECGINLMPDEISLGVDMCEDSGQATPKVIVQEGIWLRAFHSSEGEDSQDLLQFKYAIHKGYSDFLKQKGVSPLSRFDMHKLCAILKDLFPWLAISSRYYTFGKFSMIGKSENELIPWLTNLDSGPLKVHTKGPKQTLRPNEAYKSPVKPTWAPDKNRDFFDAFQYIATAFSKVSDESKLLLSTCRTHRHTYNAVAFEAHSWIEHNHANFQKVLDGIQLRTNKRPKTTQDAISSLHWCIRYISEARKKYEIFHTSKFHSLRNELGKAFEEQGQAAGRFWQLYIIEKGMLNSSRDQEIEDRFKLLMPLLAQMRHLTTFITKALINLGILSLHELRQKFDSENISLEYEEFRWLTEDDFGTAVYKYNDNIKQRRVRGFSIVKTELPTDLPSNEDPSVREWCRVTLETVKKCFNELRTSLKEFCPEYEVTEGDFPFSPDSSKRVLSDGSVEKTLSGVYILTMDIIGSTDSPQTNECKDSVIDIFRRFRQHASLYFEVIHFEEIGNDAFVVCSEDPTILWDIATKIKVEGERLIKPGERFKGTRKGLSFGAVRVVEALDGRMRITDASTPHLLPRAFGIIEGIDAHSNEYSWSRNSAIIIHERAINQCAQVLNLKLENQKRFHVQSKHFDGDCYIFDLMGSHNSAKD